MLIAVLFGVACLLLANPREFPFLVAPGGGVVLLGVLIRIWGTGHLKKNKVLATGGPYAHVRHPLYVGTFLIMFGFGMLSGSQAVLLGLLPIALVVFFVYYAPKKERVESDRLRRKFGEEFEKYRAAVWGYFPRIRPYAGRQGRFAWAGVKENREYLITFAVGVGVAVILVRYFFPDLFPALW